ncbi:hypothetical protein L4D00_15045 [Photobacterium swingsii]|uniref:hypothetical protein n=1 Tax=Photobacterium swingsii TaxID=680026 RepID=UPI003D117962
MWYYKGEPFDKRPNGYVGFVYVIKDVDSGCWYLGKKNFSSKVKGMWQESDWKTYQSSSEVVKEWTNVKKVILYLAFHDSELSYKEIELQIKTNALLRKDCANWCIGSNIKIGRLPEHMMI